jgi:hypothetical protein
MLLGTVIAKAGTVKLPELAAVPPGVVTEIGPVVTPVGAVAVIEVALSTVYEAAATPLKLTAVAPVKSVPVIVTIVPARPEEGLIPVIVGGVPPPPPPEKSVSDMSSTFALVVPVLVIRTRTEPVWLTVKEAEVNEVLATVTVPKLVQFTPLSELYSTVSVEFASVPYFA